MSITNLLLGFENCPKVAGSIFKWLLKIQEIVHYELTFANIDFRLNGKQPIIDYVKQTQPLESLLTARGKRHNDLGKLPATSVMMEIK